MNRREPRRSICSACCRWPDAGDRGRESLAPVVFHLAQSLPPKTPDPLATVSSPVRLQPGMSPLLQIPLLSLHLICMNVAAGAPLVCIWLEWKLRRKNDDVAKAAADYLAAATLVTLVAGSLLGLVMGWLLWTQEYAAIWTERLSHKMHWGALE